MGFLYSLFLKLLYPTSLCLVCLVVSAILQFRNARKFAKSQAVTGAPGVRGPRLPSFLRALAMLILVVCGNGWLVGAMTRHLEWQNLPLQPVPNADCIVVLSGGISARIPPRPTVEVGEAGDRVIYGAYLYKQGKSPRILCTGNVATGGLALRPAAEAMAEFLENLGVPKESIVTESVSENTHQHAKNLLKIFDEQSIKRVLLVTSAMHMPRSLGAFRKQCPGIEFIPAPTDFRVTERIPKPWYRELTGLVPTPSNLVLFSEAMHEYLGLAWYRLRGWA